MEKASVHAAAAEEALRHKWVESDRAGVDLGEAAVRIWFRDRWHGFVRSRWLEHLQGRRFWIEIDRGDFGLLRRAFLDQPVLLDRILDRLMAGRDNLDVVCWAADWGIPMEPVHEILEALDVNSRRLECRLDSVETPRLTLNPDWLAWDGGVVVRLAWAVALGRDLAALPILGDALEDAGCVDPEMLEPCRSGGGDARWLWLVDAILERSWQLRDGKRAATA